MSGYLTVSKITTADGKSMSTQRAVDLGLVKPVGHKPAGWGFAKDEIPVGYNTMVDNGRQLLAYLFGGRVPNGSYVCSRFGIGTGTDATNVAFTDLISPVAFYNDGIHIPLQTTKPILGVDYPVPFIARVEFQLGLTEAVGTLITELGLYAADIGTGVPTLIARKTVTGIPKSGDIAPTFLWRVRF